MQNVSSHIEPSGEEAELPPTRPDATPSRGPLLAWFVMSAIALTVLSLIGANAPPRIKLLGLFSAGIGILGGLCLDQIARMNRVRGTRAVVWGGMTLLLAGQVGMTVESYRVQAEELRNRPQADAAAVRAARLVNSALPPTDAESRATFEDMRSSFTRAGDEKRRELAHLTSFSGFLTNRVSPLGRWPVAMAVLFWLTETVLATGLGTWVLCRTSTRESR